MCFTIRKIMLLNVFFSLVKLFVIRFDFKHFLFNQNYFIFIIIFPFSIKSFLFTWFIYETFSIALTLSSNISAVLLY